MQKIGSSATHVISNYVYKDSDLLGEGSYGKVFKGLDQILCKEVAIKIISNDVLKDKFMLDSLQKEIDIMSQLHSENVVRMYGTTKDQNSTYIFIELCNGGDLLKYEKKKGGMLSEDESIQILKQILKGFKDLIQHGFIHRDVKPENTLIHNSVYKLADFGFATKIDIHGNQKIHDIVGTPIYMAPQLLGNGDYSAKSDIWSLGILLYEMIYGRTPWACRDSKSYLQNIKLFPEIRFPYDKSIRSSTKDLIIKCLEQDENKRIGWDEIFCHPSVCEDPQIQQQQSLHPQPITISQQTQKLLDNVQFMIQTCHIDFNANLVEFPSQLDMMMLHKFLNSVDPRITNYDTQKIFADIAQNSFVNKETIRKMFNRIDFSNLQDVNGRIFMELREIIKHRNLKLIDVFQQYDSHKKGVLAIEDFTILVKVIAPKIKDYEIEGLFKSFDINNDGKIDFLEFDKKLSYAMPNQENNYYKPISEKGQKILNEIRMIIQTNKLDIQGIFSLFDVEHNQLLSRQEFKSLIYMIDPNAMDDDISVIFDRFDSNHDGQISKEEFKQEISKIK